MAPPQPEDASPTRAEDEACYDGQEAYWQGEDRATNPCPAGPLRAAWFDGWDIGYEDDWGEKYPASPS